MASGRIKPSRRNYELVISHLLFADDMLIFCKGDKHSASGICDSLHKLQLFTGLTMNKQKIKLFFSKEARIKKNCCNIGST